MRKGQSHSEKAKKKMREAMMGENNPFYGKRHSEEAKQKMRGFRSNITGENHPLYGKHHSQATKNKISKNIKGKNHPTCCGENHPSKRPEQILRMKNGGSSYANSFNKSPSQPQLQLFERIRILYPSAILNYPYQNYSIDIAIPELKIAIEYDEPYWHKGKEKTDQKRQTEIEKEGWRFIRYNKLPDDNQLNQNLMQI